MGGGMTESANGGAEGLPPEWLKHQLRLSAHGELNGGLAHPRGTKHVGGAGDHGGAGGCRLLFGSPGTPPGVPPTPLGGCRPDPPPPPPPGLKKKPGRGNPTSPQHAHAGAAL